MDEPAAEIVTPGLERSGMKGISFDKQATRRRMPILAVVAVAGFCIIRLRGIFGTDPERSMANATYSDITEFNPKRLRPWRTPIEL